MRTAHPQRLISGLTAQIFSRPMKLALLFSVLALALVSCASFDSQSTDRQARLDRSQQYHRYSVMDDWFWRSRYFDNYYGAAYAGYGVWHDPWLMWTLRSGRYGGFGHWQFDPFYSPWRGIGSRFAWSGFGFGSGWGHGYPYFGPPRYGYGYRYPHRVVNGRGLLAAPNTAESAEQALLLLQQSERRNAPDFGGRPGGGIGGGFPSGSADLRSWPTQSRQDRSIMQLETPRQGDGGGLPSTERSESFPSELGRSRERSTFERSERSFEPPQRRQESESHRDRQDE